MGVLAANKFNSTYFNNGAQKEKGQKLLASEVNLLAEGLMYATEQLENAGGGEVPDDIAARLAAVEDAVSDIEDALADLTYENIKVVSFTANGSSSKTYEVQGDTYNLVVTLAWSLSQTPLSLSINGTSITPSKTGTLTSDEAVALNSIGTKTWRLSATGQKNETVSGSTSISVFNKVYYGVSSQTSPSQSVVTSLTSSLQNSHKTSFSVTAGAGEYIYYYVPSRFPSCTFNIGGFDGGFNSPTTIAITNSNGYTENYKCYRSTNANLGQTTVTVKT